MKTILSILLLSFTISLHALDVTNTRPVTFGFKWVPQVDQMGGLPTNQYLTNIAFRLYSVTNITVPMTNWTVLATWPAVDFLAQGPCGSDWFHPITIDSRTRFFALTAYSSRSPGGGESPFSNVEFLLGPLPSGVLLPLR